MTDTTHAAPPVARPGNLVDVREAMIDFLRGTDATDPRHGITAHWLATLPTAGGVPALTVNGAGYQPQSWREAYELVAAALRGRTHAAPATLDGGRWISLTPRELATVLAGLLLVRDTPVLPDHTRADLNDEPLLDDDAIAQLVDALTDGRVTLYRVDADARRI